MPRERKRSSGCSSPLGDVVDGLLNRLDLLGILIRNFGLELFFERHDQLNRIQGIRAKVIHKRGLVGDFFFLHTELFGNDALDLFLNAAQMSMSSCRES